VITFHYVNVTVSLYNLFLKKFGFVITLTPFNLVWPLAGRSDRVQLTEEIIAFYIKHSFMLFKGIRESMPLTLSVPN
jgi:hypothetical protein